MTSTAQEKEPAEGWGEASADEGADGLASDGHSHDGGADGAAGEDPGESEADGAA